MMPPWHRLTEYAIIFKCCNWNLLLSAYCHFSIPLKARKPLLPLLYKFNAIFCTQKELVFHQEHFVCLKCCENTGLVNTAGYKSILENDSVKKKRHFAISCFWGQPESLHLIGFLTWKLFWAPSFGHSIIRNKDPAGEGRAWYTSRYLPRCTFLRPMDAPRCFWGPHLRNRMALLLMVCDKGELYVAFSAEAGLQMG